jgi:hypothetical protein
MMAVKVELTGRNFEIIRFRDRYDVECSLQQSSLAEFEPPGSSAVWLGVEDNRMHLDLEQVKSLMKVLSRWVESGSFRR